jgi:integrase
MGGQSHEEATMKSDPDRARVFVREYKDRPTYVLEWKDPITGRRRFKTTAIARGGRRNKAEAERAAGDWEDELDSGAVGSGKMTWEKFRDLYEDQKLPGLAEGTRDKVNDVFNKLERELNPRYVRDLTEARLSHFVAVLRSSRLAEDTIRSILAHIKSALSWAVEQKLLGRLPAFPKLRRVKKATGTPMKGRPITPEEFDRMVAAIPAVVGLDHAPAWERYLRGLDASGLRLEESLDLRWDDDGRIRPRFAEGRLPVLVIPAECEKGFMDREHPMAPEFAIMLQEVPVERRRGFVFRLNGRGHGGSRLKANAVSKTVSDIGEAAGVKVYTHPRTGKVKFASAHDLRRTFGERWAARLMPVQLMELMRHKNIETTLRYYVGANAQRTAQSIWAAFQQQGQVSPAAPAGEVDFEVARNRTRNSGLSGDEKTTRPGVIRTHDQGIMSPLL